MRANHIRETKRICILLQLIVMFYLDTVEKFE